MTKDAEKISDISRDQSTSRRWKSQLKNDCTEVLMFFTEMIMNKPIERRKS